MTRPDAQVPPPAPSATEVEYVRKLSLAILSTLQAKGLLSADEVDAVLIAARRAAQGAPVATPAPAAPRPLAAPAMQVTVQPATSLTFHAHARALQAEPEVGTPPAVDAVEEVPDPSSGEAQATESPEPLTVEAPSQPTELGPDTVGDGTVPSAALEAPEASPVPPQVPEPEAGSVEPPAQTIVIGPDEVEERTDPETATAAADDLVLDGPTQTKPTEEPKPAVPTFDLKLD
ncbi:hypothetical protein F8S09_05010 [Deinococcus sp. SDU3-2]|uniref:Uncharacterized protein n=1 Tax=Deinococcus terrestris TaxID=2651870 RepID=A0A7X1TR49_9DEIO|nr:hypothetical protein [Deinococcus terrestris]MPY66056.1 hypothetical protein [Deinococcus terrestris]